MEFALCWCTLYIVYFILCYITTFSCIYILLASSLTNWLIDVVPIYLRILLRICLIHTGLIYINVVVDDSLYFHFFNTFLFVNIFVYSHSCFILMKCGVIVCFFFSFSKLVENIWQTIFSKEHIFTISA